MDKKELLEELKHLDSFDDPELVHSIADDLLLKFIDDEAIKEAFKKLNLWYA